MFLTKTIGLTQIYRPSLIGIILVFGLVLSANQVFAQIQEKCVQQADVKNDCGVTDPDPKISYECMGTMEDFNCKNMGGGFVVQDKSKYPGCFDTQGCCEAPICSADGTPPEEAGSDSGATKSAPPPITGSTAKWDYGGKAGGLRLVACTKDGNCELKDIVQQGIYFADFLIGLSGALFLIAFIWGGAMYLLSFGREGWVSKGRDAMVKSSIGIVFIMLAWTIVTYVAASLGYSGV